MVKFKEECLWFIHNAVAHPILAFTNIIGKHIEIIGLFGTMIHDSTIPKG